MQKSIKNIAFAGSGNVACHLAKGLQMQGYRISNVWSRDFSNAMALAKGFNSRACQEISGLREGTDLIIIAVADKAIEEVARNIGEFDGIVVHTAGSVSIDVLKGNIENSGVFYPLQTFSKVIPVDLMEVPFFLESSSIEVLQVLEEVASKLSTRVYNADSHQRILLHVAAVFTGNFSNLMYVIGNEILENANLPSDLLHPLILEIARKAATGDPLQMQTGPARRKDTVTIEKHISALASMPEYADLYRLLANLISNKYK